MRTAGSPLPLFGSLVCPFLSFFLFILTLLSRSPRPYYFSLNELPVFKDQGELRLLALPLASALNSVSVAAIRKRRSVCLLRGLATQRRAGRLTAIGGCYCGMCLLSERRKPVHAKEGEQ